MALRNASVAGLPVSMRVGELVGRSSRDAAAAIVTAGEDKCEEDNRRSLRFTLRDLGEFDSAGSRTGRSNGEWSMRSIARFVVVALLEDGCGDSV